MTNEFRPDREPEGSLLDPYHDPDRWERIVGQIRESAAPLLAARRSASLAQTLSSWRRPVVFGSASLVAAAALALLLFPRIEPVSEATLAEAVMPWPVAGWMDGSYAPTVQELVLAVEEYTP